MADPSEKFGCKDKGNYSITQTNKDNVTDSGQGS